MDDATRLARVRWYQGQVLRPEHLRMLEESILEELRLRLAPAPQLGCGILQLELSAKELAAQKQVRVSSLAVVLADGQLVAFPGNVQLDPMPIDEKQTPSRLRVFLNIFPREMDARPKATGAKDPIEKVFWKAVLAPAVLPGVDRAVELCRLRREPAAPWELDPDFTPQLLQVPKSPFLTWLDHEFADQASRLRASAAQTLGDETLGAARRSELRRFIAAVHRTLALLADRKQVSPHPYTLFVALRDYYLELCCMQELSMESLCLPAYDHENLSDCFNELRQLIYRASVSRPPLLLHQEFVRSDAYLQIAQLSAKLGLAKQVYLLVKWPTPESRRSLLDLKLASLSRIDLVCRSALRGVPVTSGADPSLLATLASDLEVHTLDRGEEWRLALAEGTLALRAPLPERNECTFSLAWRDA